MADELLGRLTRYRADVEAALNADFARRDLSSREAGSHYAGPMLIEIDHVLRPEPDTSTPHDRRRPMLVATLSAVAAITALLMVALVAGRDADTTPVDQPSPTVTVPATTPPRAMPNSTAPSGGPLFLAPGTYYVDEVDGTPTPRIFATIGAGWRDSATTQGWSIAKNDGDVDISNLDAFVQHEVGGMTFSNPVAVYVDACHPELGFHSGAVDTLDGLVTALTEQQGWAELTTPSDISVDGYEGKEFRRTVPTDVSDCTTTFGRPRVPNGMPALDFRSWDNGEGWGDHYHEPGQIETLWVLDLDGTIVVISTGVWPEPSAGADPDFAADVLDSIRIDRP